MAAEAPLGPPAGACWAARFLDILILVHEVRGRLKTTLHWGCGLRVDVSELDLMLSAALGVVVATSWCDDVVADAFAVAGYATRWWLRVSARRGGEEGKPYRPLLSTLLALPLRGGAM